MDGLAGGPVASERETSREASDTIRRYSVCAVGGDVVLWEGIKVVCGDSPFDITAVAESVSCLLGRGANEWRPDVALLDLSSGLKKVKNQTGQLVSAFPDVRIVVLSETACVQSLRECARAGAHSFLTKDLGAQIFLRSLSLTALGGRVFPTRTLGLPFAKRVEPNPRKFLNPCGLSKREMEIACLILSGESNKRIANRLTISESTVKGHVNRILRKTQVSNRTQAAIMVAAARSDLEIGLFDA